jgi:outer membrane lipoprotein-sorting protein
MRRNYVTGKPRISFAVIASLLIVVAVLFGSEVRAKSGQKELLGAIPSLSSKSMQVEQADGNVFVDKWLAAANKFKDYSFNFAMTVCKDSGHKVNEKGTLYFKQPRMLRLEITSGPKSGSVAVLMKDGSVKAHMGGAMKFLSVSLAPDSNLLKSANGWPMVKSDFASLAEAVKGYIKEGCNGKVSANPVALEGYANKLYDWTLFKSGGVIYKRALFDPSTMMPVEWWDYVDGKLYAHSVWTNFKPDPGLPDKTFTIKGGL